MGSKNECMKSGWYQSHNLYPVTDCFREDFEADGCDFKPIYPWYNFQEFLGGFVVLNSQYVK